MGSKTSYRCNFSRRIGFRGQNGDSERTVGENQGFSDFFSVFIGIFQLFSFRMANTEVPGPLSNAKLPGEFKFAVKMAPSGLLMPTNGRFLAKKPHENDHFLGTDGHVLCSTGWDVAGRTPGCPD